MVYDNSGEINVVQLWRGHGGNSGMWATDEDGGAHDSRLKVKTLILAFLALFYHVDHALAENTLDGSATDGHLAIAWEYDLEQGTGQLLIENLNVEFDNDQRLYFPTLFPPDSTELEYDSSLISLGPCDQCLSAVCPAIQLSAKLPPGSETVIGFQLPAASWETELGATTLEYGIFTSGCTLGPLTPIQQFITVRPIEPGCRADALSNPGDVGVQLVNERLDPDLDSSR